MSALSQSRSTSNINRMRQLFEGGSGGGGGSSSAPRPAPLSRCRSEVITTRGFKPSDIKDPTKTRILQDLTFKIWGRNLEAGSSGPPNGAPKPIDLQKLFTPAEDAPEILPRNKKMFASSSFYGPNHPTMEEQVELARRISSSLSDISNKESKGQSMYVNRKKRSVKWVHQGEGQSFSEFSETSHTENLPPTPKVTEKPVLKLVMNPRGKVQDFNSLRGSQPVDTTPSPEVCFDLVKDLNSPCGKGAELFAKRRKKAEKWVVDESNVKTTSELTTMSSYESSYSSQTSSQTSQSMQLGKLATATLPPNLGSLPTLTYMKDVPARFAPSAAKNQIPDKYTLPKVRMIKSPWEAALSGNVDSAFQENASSGASPTPRGHVLIAPSPSSFNKMATPPPPQAPSVDVYSTKPPKAWHPQPTGKQFSSVKLEQIFAGSAKSPVSLAYHADTNTLSSEPVLVENVPPIAAKLYDYEIIDPSILREPKARRPDQILADVEPPVANGKWPPNEEEHEAVGSVIWSANTAHWATTTSGVKWMSDSSQQSQSSVQQNRVQWPPQLVQEDIAVSATKPVPQIATLTKPSMVQPTKPFVPQTQPFVPQTQPFVPQTQPFVPQTQPFVPQTQPTVPQTQQFVPPTQPSVQPKKAPQQQTQYKPTVFTTQAPQQIPWKPQMASSATELSQEVQEKVHSTLQHSLSEIQSAMSQTCQNFTKIESSQHKKMETVQSHQEFNVSQDIQSIKEETHAESQIQQSSSAISTMEQTEQSETVCSSEQISSSESAQMSLEVNATDTLKESNVSETQFEELVKTENVAASESSLLQSNFNEILNNEETLNQSKESVQESLESVTQSKVSESVETASIENKQEAVVEQTLTESKAALTENASEKTAINGFDTGCESTQSFMEVKKAEEKQSSQIVSDLSFKSEVSSSTEQQMTSSQTTKTESFVQQQQSHASEVSKSQFIGSHAVNGVKSEGFVATDRISGFNSSQAFSSLGKSEYKSMQQESQYAESASSRLSLSVMSTTDEEVQDLCEREFNQISMQYEKVNKPDIKKPAAVLPGAVKVFPTANDFMPVTKSLPTSVKKVQSVSQVSSQSNHVESKVSSQASQFGAVKEPARKPYKKPASAVPGAKPLFGEAIELHLGFDEYGEGGDRPYEKIPVKNLIKTFEESTRPFMKSKTQVEQSTVTEQQTVQQSSLSQQSLSEQAFRTSLYETFPSSDNIPSFQGDFKSQAPAVNQDWSQIQVPASNQNASTPTDIHVDLSNVNNFNTAARGWNSKAAVYKPVTFSSVAAPHYSDF